MPRLLPVFVCVAFATLNAQSNYEHNVAGNAQDVQRPTRSGFVLMGGGRDVEAAFRWMIERSGGGDFLVLRASGTDAYNGFVMKLGGADSAETLILKDRSASSEPFVLERVKNAEAIWLAGGNQWNYINFWKDTPLSKVLQSAIDRGVPMGGTSAGLAVLGEHYFSAEHGTIQTADAVKDPFHPKMALGSGFLRIPPLAGIITDSHFAARTRQGRLLAMMARLNARGLGVDERTAVLVEPDGSGVVAGEGKAWMLRGTAPPEVCRKSSPLTYTGVELIRVGNGQKLDLREWTAETTDRTEISVLEGAVLR